MPFPAPLLVAFPALFPAPLPALFPAPFPAPLLVPFPALLLEDPERLDDAASFEEDALLEDALFEDDEPPDEAPLPAPFPFDAPCPGAAELLPRSWPCDAAGRPPFAAVAGRATEVSAMAALTVQMTAMAGADRRFMLL